MPRQKFRISTVLLLLLLSHFAFDYNTLTRLAESKAASVDLTFTHQNLNNDLVDVGSVVDDRALHLPIAVGDVDNLSRLELGAGDALEAGPDDLVLQVLLGAATAVETH